jgi:hypothetical protein
MTTIPADAPRSEDGQWWWDGAQWQPVDDIGAGAGAQSAAAPDPSATPDRSSSAAAETPAARGEVNSSGVAYTATAELAEGTEIGTIDMSISEIESILTAAGIDLGDSSSGGDLVAQQNPSEENA